jgi:putative hydrolase of the HAD superfamily
MDRLGGNGLKAVVFDYGNTLIEFAEQQIRRCDLALAEALEALYGPVHHERLTAIRNADRRAPYQGDFRENDLAQITAALVRALYDVDCESDALERLLNVRHDSLVESIRAEAHVIELIEQLRARYKVGLLSNYPCGKAIRASLKRERLDGCFDAVVVSADVGHVKPHELPFRTVLGQLGVEPHEAVYIGDNWLADIQGAKRVGMRAVLTRQYDTPEKFDPQPGDHQPDAVIGHLRELTVHLSI